MNSGKITKLKIPALNEFKFQIKHTETDQSNHVNGILLHTHCEFELYVNLSGDVSFLVENNLYELSRGDVIVARPGEYHHCVYRSDAPHKLFWILFDSQKNKEILDFLKEEFCENYVSPKENLREELIDLCYALYEGALTDEEKIYTFFRIFAILKQSKNNTNEKSVLPQDLCKIMEYIDRHIHEEIIITDIVKALFISQRTLERRFKEVLNTTPLQYIRKKKLMLAAKLMREGESVLSAGLSVGYNDNSYFIELFKRYYKLTPYQYKKNYNIDNELK
jgi:AraC-like DNA-binding protein/quercetin dioxygenase-like cupin family protein